MRNLRREKPPGVQANAWRRFLSSFREEKAGVQLHVSFMAHPPEVGTETAGLAAKEFESIGAHIG